MYFFCPFNRIISYTALKLDLISQFFYWKNFSRSDEFLRFDKLLKDFLRSAKSMVIWIYSVWRMMCAQARVIFSIIILVVIGLYIKTKLKVSFRFRRPPRGRTEETCANYFSRKEKNKF